MRAERPRRAIPHTRPRGLLGPTLLVLLLAGCEGGSSGPREPSFPSFDARALFPELTRAEDEATVGDRKDGESSRSAFEQALRGEPPNVGGGEQAEPGQATSNQKVPLGANLVASLPADRGSWRWSTEEGATLIVHGAGAGRPDALVYTETFREGVGERPSSELRRFQLTVNPEGPGATVLGEAAGTALGILENRLRETATRGRGLGFRPGEEERSTGLRWVGRNEHRVILRFARHGGSWQDQRPLPQRLRSALGSSVDQASTGDLPVQPLGRVSAYLLVGNAQEPDGTFGAHLAVLCARIPDCPVAEELADLLTSIHVEAPDRIRRLREDYQADFADLARSAGLETLDPRAGTEAQPGEAAEPEDFSEPAP